MKVVEKLRVDGGAGWGKSEFLKRKFELDNEGGGG